MVTEPLHAVITGSGTALPGAVTQDALWQGYFGNHFGYRRAAKLAFQSAGVTTRHSAINPVVEDISHWSTGARMERYLVEALPLGKGALTEALDAAHLSPEDIGLFTVVSCTGYATPGLDVLLARDVGMSPSVQRLCIGHVGCHAALPAIQIVSDYVVAHKKAALLLCLELPSLHIQPPTSDLEQVVVHSLFGDAAAAVVVEPAGVSSPSGLQVVDVIARTDTASIDAMTWRITDHGFRMTLSRRVSDVVGEEIEALVGELLARNGLTRDLVEAWAIHPGGPRILDVVAERLGLGADDLASSRRILSEHGNCSSATVLMVLDEVRIQLATSPLRNLIALAFGPGLTLYAALLRTT